MEFPPFLETEMYLNFKSGLYKYAGLLEMAEAYGILEKQGNTYFLTDGTKLGGKRALKEKPSIWEEHLLPALDQALKDDLQFSSEADALADEIEELKKEDK